MTKTAWSHLPNAQHIDRILSHFESHTADWGQAWTQAQTLDQARDRAWNQARDRARDQAREQAWEQARERAWDWTDGAAWYAACSPILALVAWDQAADYLNLSADQVKMMEVLGDKKAILMLPAVMIFKKSKELV